MMWQFTPDEAGKSVQIPYLEDAKGEYAPNYASKKTPEQAIVNLVSALSILGAAFLGATPGTFEDGDVRRYGYIIRFAYGTGIGEIRVAGLPMRATETANKIQQARTQAILTARDMFQAIHQAQVFIPGAADFVMLYLLVDPKNKPGVTLRDHLRATGDMPELPQFTQKD
jgi:hypothetical protein